MNVPRSEVVLRTRGYRGPGLVLVGEPRFEFLVAHQPSQAGPHSLPSFGCVGFRDAEEFGAAGFSFEAPMWNFRAWIFGIATHFHDVYGNVAGWCLDSAARYDQAKPRAGNGLGPGSGARRIVREGGAMAGAGRPVGRSGAAGQDPSRGFARLPAGPARSGDPCGGAVSPDRETVVWQGSG